MSAVLDLIYDSSSWQSSQSCFGVSDLINFLPESFSVSFISLSAAFNYGMNGLVCLKWHDAFLSFLLNSPRMISLALSQIIASSTPFHWKRRNNVSLASLFSFFGNKQDQPKFVAKICAHPLSLLDTVAANNELLYALYSSLPAEVASVCIEGQLAQQMF